MVQASTRNQPAYVLFACSFVGHALTVSCTIQAMKDEGGGASPGVRARSGLSKDSLSRSFLSGQTAPCSKIDPIRDHLDISQRIWPAY